MRCKATVYEEREDKQCKRTAVFRGFCALRGHAPVLAGERWSDEECARCRHSWGNHGYSQPHKCTRKDLGCECPGFEAHAEEGET